MYVTKTLVNAICKKNVVIIRMYPTKPKPLTQKRLIPTIDDHPVVDESLDTILQSSGHMTQYAIGTGSTNLFRSALMSKPIRNST